jgi:hypothetical protein
MISDSGLNNELQSLFEETKKKLLNAHATISREEMEVAFTAGEREYYENDEGFAIPDDLFDLYAELNGLEFRWSISDENGELAGFFHIHHFLDVMDNETEDKLWADWYEGEDIAAIKKHRIFETIHGSDNYITIKIEADKSYSLYYVQEGCVNFGGSKELSKIPLTIEQYMKVIMRYFGLYSVRHHLHKEDFYTDPKKYIPEYDQLIKRIPDFK